MEETIYRITLLLTGLMNLGMAIVLHRHTNRYVKYPAYRMARVLTSIWITAFAIGYFLHAIFIWRNTWPTAASEKKRRLSRLKHLIPMVVMSCSIRPTPMVPVL